MSAEQDWTTTVLFITTVAGFGLAIYQQIHSHRKEKRKEKKEEKKEKTAEYDKQLQYGESVIKGCAKERQIIYDAYCKDPTGSTDDWKSGGASMSAHLVIDILGSLVYSFEDERFPKKEFLKRHYDTIIKSWIAIQAYPKRHTDGSWSKFVRVYAEAEEFRMNNFPAEPIPEPPCK